MYIKQRTMQDTDTRPITTCSSLTLRLTGQLPFITVQPLGVAPRAWSSQLYSLKYR